MNEGSISSKNWLQQNMVLGQLFTNEHSTVYSPVQFRQFEKYIYIHMYICIYIYIYIYIKMSFYKILLHCLKTIMFKSVYITEQLRHNL